MLTKIARSRSSIETIAATRRLASYNTARLLTSSTDSKEFPSSADVVIAGAGSVGSSVAYHLANLGHTNVVVLEQGSLGCGTSWHAVGLIGALRSVALQSRMSEYACQLYADLENLTGYGTGFKNCGAVLVAKSKDRATALRRIADNARQNGTRVEELSPRDAQKLYPIMQIDDIHMALWSPDEGVANASDVCSSLMKGATQKGVRFIEGVSVNHITTNGKEVVGVETDKGFIHCDKFINCSGLWARELGLRSDPIVNIPLHACEHFYIVTKAMDGVHTMLPTLRDYDARFYIREWSGGLMAGGFEPVSKPCFYDSGIPEKFEFQLLQEDWDHFDIIMQGLLNRIPSLETAEIRQFVNGPESFTPDGKYLFGEVPEIDNYYVAAGMNSSGIVCAGGMGKMMAELVTHGRCSWDTSPIDIKRFSKEQNNRLFLRDRVKEVLGSHYAVSYPNKSLDAARPLKCSPLYDLLNQNGAHWQETSGWEIASFFSKTKESFPLTYSKPGWLPSAEKECKACKEAVGLVDMSWQSKFEITSKTGDKAAAELQYIFAEDMDMPIGSSVTSAFLSDDGKYSGVAHVCRLSEDRFFLATSPSQHNHFLSWLNRNAKTADCLEITDVTSKYSSLAVLGPYSERVLKELTKTSLEAKDFAVGRCKVLSLGYASDVILCRGFLASCDNWQAFMPNELVRGLFQMIKNNKVAPNTELVGQYALDSLRLEAAIPNYGLEFGPQTSPAQMGNVSFVNVTKTAPFIGKEAAIQSLGHSTKSLLRISIDEIDDDCWAWGGEPICIDEKAAGNLSSVAYCFTRNKLIGFAMLDVAMAKSGALTVTVAGKKCLASVVDS